MIPAVGESLKGRRKAMYMRQIDGIRTKYERTVNYNVKRAGRKLEKDLLAIEEPTNVDILIAVAKNRGYIEKILTTVYNDILADVQPMITGKKSIQVKKSTSEAIDITDDYAYEQVRAFNLRIEDRVRKQIGINIVRIDDTTVKHVQDMLYQSRTTREFHEMLKPYFDSDWPNRSYTIARTETAVATNMTMYESIKEFDTGRKKLTQWFAWDDELTRADHSAMNMKTVDFGQPFEVPNRYGGFDLMSYPGDNSQGATAGNVINCRCEYFTKYDD